MNPIRLSSSQAEPLNGYGYFRVKRKRLLIWVDTLDHRKIITTSRFKMEDKEKIHLEKMLSVRTTYATI